MQHHRPRRELQPGKMEMSRNDIHEIGQLDPEDVTEVEELRPGGLVEVEGFDGGEEGVGDGLGHVSAELAPEGAAVVHGGRETGPCCV